MNGEYAGFFDIGMVQRNEENAIIVHGTMPDPAQRARHGRAGRATRSARTPISASPSSSRATLYTVALRPRPPARYLRCLRAPPLGLWGLQIMRKHWRRFMPGMSTTGARVRDRLAQLARRRDDRRAGRDPQLVWVPVVAFMGVAIPDKVLTLDHGGVRGLGRAFCHAVPSSRRDLARADGGRAPYRCAVAMGLVTEHLPFVRTARAAARRGSASPSRPSMRPSWAAS